MFKKITEFIRSIFHTREVFKYRTLTTRALFGLEESYGFYCDFLKKQIKSFKIQNIILLVLIILCLHQIFTMKNVAQLKCKECPTQVSCPICPDPVICPEIPEFPDFESVYFGYNDYVLKSEKTKVDQVINYLKKNKNRAVTLYGNTCSAGTIDSNNELAKMRIEEVTMYLKAHGIEENRINSAVNNGEHKSERTNRTKEGRAHNRRVEFKITEYPNKSPQPIF